MRSTLNLCLLSAVMLAALLHCVPGAPLEDASADNPAGDPSGDLSFDEVENPPDELQKVWALAIETITSHRANLENEFPVNYLDLKNYNISYLPEACPHSNFRKEAYLRKLVQGLLTYTVLLKHVEKEYPSSKSYSGRLHNLINHIKEKMKHQEKVTVLTSSQEEQLLQDIDSPSMFDRKMTAHSIMYHLRDFLVDCKRFIIKKLRAPEEA